MIILVASFLLSLLNLSWKPPTQPDFGLVIQSPPRYRKAAPILESDEGMLFSGQIIVVLSVIDPMLCRTDVPFISVQATQKYSNQNICLPTVNKEVTVLFLPSPQ